MLTFTWGQHVSAFFFRMPFFRGKILPTPKETNLRIWVQLLWEFGHFAPQQWFFVPKNSTILGCFHPLLRVPIPMLAHADDRTLCSFNMSIDHLGDHVHTCKKYTGSTYCHNHLMDGLANLMRAHRSFACQPQGVDIVWQQVMAPASRTTMKSHISLSLTEIVWLLMCPLCVGSGASAMHVGDRTIVIVTRIKSGPRLNGAL